MILLLNIQFFIDLQNCRNLYLVRVYLLVFITADYVNFCRPKSKEDLLYQVPEHINVRSKIMASEEMLSNQMLSGIPEVDLGIDAKIRNIEATEAAKQAVIEEQRYKKSKEPTEMVPTNMAVNFMLHSRCKLCFNL